MFKHLLINRFKVILRNKVVVFWTLIFPIIMATFFYLAFSNLTQIEKFKAIDIAVLENDNFLNEKNFKTVLENISKDNEEKILNIEYVDSEETAESLLKDNKISGYYKIEDKIKIVVKKNGLEQTIMKYIVDNYYSTTSIIGNIVSFNHELFNMNLINELNKEGNYFKDVSNNNVDFTVVYFYTLIGMVCLYAGFFGMDTAREVEANLSKRAARVTISGVHKLKILLSSLVVDFVISYSELLILFLYMILVLGVNFGNQLIWILILSLVGNISGLALGLLIGVSNRKSEGLKSAILLAFTMSCSFLAGMMMWTMKYIITKHVPFLNNINPVSIITDGLYSLYYYSDLNRYFYNVINLFILCFIMITISYFFIRRKNYDSI